MSHLGIVWTGFFIHPDTATKHLFDPRPAYRFRRIHNTASGPASLMGGQDPQYGANIDYYVQADTNTSDATIQRLLAAANSAP